MSQKFLMISGKPSILLYDTTVKKAAISLMPFRSRIYYHPWWCAIERRYIRVVAHLKVPTTAAPNSKCPNCSYKNDENIFIRTNLYQDLARMKFVYFTKRIIRDDEEICLESNSRRHKTEVTISYLRSVVCMSAVLCLWLERCKETRRPARISSLITTLA